MPTDPPAPPAGFDPATWEAAVAEARSAALRHRIAGQPADEVWDYALRAAWEVLRRPTLAERITGWFARRDLTCDGTSHWPHDFGVRATDLAHPGRDNESSDDD